MKDYHSLWKTLDEARQKAIRDGHSLLEAPPRSDAARYDPYRVFRSFPTQLITGDTTVFLVEHADPLQKWSNLCQDKLFYYAVDILPDQDRVSNLLNTLSQNNGSTSVRELCEKMPYTTAQTIRAIATLAKVDFLKLSNPSSIK